MQLKNLNKNLIGIIIIIVSILLVFLCMGMIMTSMMSESIDSNVEWNGYTFWVPGDAEVTKTDDSLILKSPYENHNVEVKKTSDLTNYRKNIEGATECAYVDVNTTHVMITNDKAGYGAIVPKDVVDMNSTDKLYQINGNPEIIELKGDPMFLMSFISSAKQG